MKYTIIVLQLLVTVKHSDIPTRHIEFGLCDIEGGQMAIATDVSVSHMYQLEEFLMRFGPADGFVERIHIRKTYINVRTVLRYTNRNESRTIQYIRFRGSIISNFLRRVMNADCFFATITKCEFKHTGHHLSFSWSPPQLLYKFAEVKKTIRNPIVEDFEPTEIPALSCEYNQNPKPPHMEIRNGSLHLRVKSTTIHDPILFLFPLEISIVPKSNETVI